MGSGFWAKQLFFLFFSYIACSLSLWKSHQDSLRSWEEENLRGEVTDIFFVATIWLFPKNMQYPIPCLKTFFS